MLLSELRNILQTLQEVAFILPDGTRVPAHFHLTEIGQLDKRFMDCGGTIRRESIISMQLWTSLDIWHRLDAQKTIRIIDTAIHQLALGDHSVEVEYQGETIQKFNLDFDHDVFRLQPINTACLAADACGIPTLSEVKEKVSSCCAPGSGCC